MVIAFLTKCSIVVVDNEKGHTMSGINLPFDLNALRDAIFQEEHATNRFKQPPYLYMSEIQQRHSIVIATAPDFLNNYILPNPGYRAYLMGLIEKWCPQTGVKHD